MRELTPIVSARNGVGIAGLVLVVAGCAAIATWAYAIYSLLVHGSVWSIQWTTWLPIDPAVEVFVIAPGVAYGAGRLGCGLVAGSWERRLPPHAER